MAAIRRKSDLVRFQEVTLDNILDTIAGQAMGFHFGTPKRVDEKALAVVLPILRDGEFVREYITYPEVTDKVRASDSGTINKVILKNNTDTRVFVRSGTVFEGKGTQSRTITRSAILFPGKEVSLDARCVHASHGIRTGADFGYHGTISLDVEKSSYRSGFTPVDQHQYWANVMASNTLKSRSFTGIVTEASMDSTFDESMTISTHDSGLTTSGCFGGVESLIERRGLAPSPERSVRLGGSRRAAIRGSAGAASAGPRPSFSSGRPQGSHRNPGEQIHVNRPAPDSFVQNDTVFTQNLDDILSKVKLHDHQVGISLITDRGVETIELFEMDLSWAALHKDSVKRMGTELIKEEKEDVFEYKPEKAIEQVTRVLAQNFDANTIFDHKADGADRVIITGLTSATHIGEVVELGGKVIHLSLLKRAA